MIDIKELKNKVRLLSDRELAIIHLQYNIGLNPAESARVLRCPLSAVQNARRRVIAKIKQAYGIGSSRRLV